MSLIILVLVSNLICQFSYDWPEIGSPQFDIRTLHPLKQVVKQPPPARRILYFTAEWCGPCQQIQSPELKRMEKTKWRIGSKIKRVDDHIWEYDHERDSDKVTKFQVSLFPTFILVDADGKELHRVTGTQTSYQLLELYQRK